MNPGEEITDLDIKFLEDCIKDALNPSNKIILSIFDPKSIENMDPKPFLRTLITYGEMASGRTNDEGELYGMEEIEGHLTDDEIVQIETALINKIKKSGSLISLKTVDYLDSQRIVWLRIGDVIWEEVGPITVDYCLERASINGVNPEDYNFSLESEAFDYAPNYGTLEIDSQIDQPVIHTGRARVAGIPTPLSKMKEVNKSTTLRIEKVDLSIPDKEMKCLESQPPPK